MTKLTEFTLYGYDVVPWSVPDIGNAVTKTGKRVRFARRPKKTVPHLGKISFDQWKAAVAKAAKAAFGADPVIGPIRLHIEFFSKTPKGKRHGELWVIEVAQNAKGDWVKKGKSSPDLINCIKGTEDALQDVLYFNDVQTRMISSVALYGPLPGIRVVAYSIAPEDFPGRGEPAV